MAAKAKRKPAKPSRKQPAWHRRLDWPVAGLLLLLMAAFFLPQRAWLESGWYQLTAHFHPKPEKKTPWLLVEIDQASQEKLGAWPWDQHQFSLIVEQILAMRPTALVVLQQPPTHWTRESLHLLKDLNSQSPNPILQDLSRQLDSPAPLYQLSKLRYASLPGPGPQDWPEGLPAIPASTPEHWQRLFQPWMERLETSPPNGLEDGGQLHPRPAALIQAPLLRGTWPGQAHRPAWFELDENRTPALALRLQAEQAGISPTRLQFTPGRIQAGKLQWRVEQGGGYWPSLHPDNLPRIHLSQLLNHPENLKGRWVLLHVQQTPSSQDEWLEAQATASLFQHNQSITPWFVPLLQWLVLGLMAWLLSRNGPAALKPGWTFSLIALVLLNLVAAQVLQGWLQWWIQPAWPAMALVVMQAAHWLRYSGFTLHPDKALQNTRLQLAQSLTAQQQWQAAWNLLKKLPHNPGRFRAMESLYLACESEEPRLGKQILQQLQQHKPGYQPTAPKNTGKPADSTALLEKTDILPAEPPAGDSLSRYQLIEELGRGAMAVVHRARDEKLGRDVALKVLPLGGQAPASKQQEIYRRFMQEARAAARLRHPNIVTVYDVGEDGKRAWIAMDLIEGEDLSRHSRAESLLPLQQLLPLMVQVAEALDYAHQHGVIHRDIKPANMLYEKQGGRIVVTDFGVASLQDASQTRTGTVLGSPSYMAPEQVNGKSVDGRADIYALGVSLYQLSTGRLPFEGDTLANVMYRITHEKCTPPRRIRPELPERLEAIILKAMHKQAGRRFATGEKLAQALRELLAGH